MTEVAAALLRELELAHAIIQNALNLMTTEQKRAWADANDSANLIESGTTRYHERRKAIADARAALASGVTEAPAPLTDERILHLWDSYVNYETGRRSAQGMPLTNDDKLQFARAVLRASGVRVWTEADQAAWMALPEEERRRRNHEEAARGVKGKTE